jgi:hypothetical protein
MLELMFVSSLLPLLIVQPLLTHAPLLLPLVPSLLLLLPPPRRLVPLPLLPVLLLLLPVTWLPPPPLPLATPRASAHVAFAARADAGRMTTR